MDSMVVVEGETQWYMFCSDALNDFWKMFSAWQDIIVRLSRVGIVMLIDNLINFSDQQWYIWRAANVYKKGMFLNWSYFPKADIVFGFYQEIWK